jgi:hypothetical protein
MRTTTRNIRLTHTLLDLIDKEAERRKCGQADIIREALARYFEGRQIEAAMLGLEQRLGHRLDLQNQRLTDGLQKIMSLAEPV